MDVDPQVLNGEDTRAAPPHPGATRCHEPDETSAPMYNGSDSEELGHQTAQSTPQHRSGLSRRQIARTILLIVISMALIAAMTGLFVIGWSHSYVG